MSQPQSCSECFKSILIYGSLFTNEYEEGLKRFSSPGGNFAAFNNIPRFRDVVKCAINGNNLCVTGPTKSLHFFNAEVVLITLWDAIDILHSIQLSGPPQHLKYVVF